ncbi:MAG: ThuA domain-containing protein, partial [Segetibacter sp.]
MRKVFFLMIVALCLFNACSNKRINRTATNNGAGQDNTATGMASAGAVSVSGNRNTSRVSNANLKSPRRGEVLFLGNVGKHHDAGKYAPWLAISLFKIGVNVTYTTDLNDLNTGNLDKYDGLIIYSNHDSISPSQEAALKGFVEGGKGLIPIHSAAGCFRNSEWYINAVGAQYQSETTGNFTATIVNKTNPVMQGLTEFETWDEKYVHQKINPDKTVLMERID